MTVKELIDALMACDMNAEVRDESTEKPVVDVDDDTTDGSVLLVLG